MLSLSGLYDFFSSSNLLAPIVDETPEEAPRPLSSRDDCGLNASINSS